ncbi:hypothetical protein PHLGIDRAFT_124917 [Phlebiopsis gigantea 11061_1 CR5-6]|uniref:RNA exonuclease 4 n=1 Tax=Phlebiopsis gigantea (strain 11061_1 CR5-6) TaxID=745531 RepID=A0A0C3SF06_PHLG1|nr:hypothetical protein PHLGIDRAFT_124917 [Phlebiopsis gigantea 11061_1 CR5-6]
MSNTRKATAPKIPSENWAALQKKIKAEPTATQSGTQAGKRALRDSFIKSGKFRFKPKTPVVATKPRRPVEETSFPRGLEEPVASTSALKLDEMRNGESMETLRRMIRGDETTAESTAPGARKYTVEVLRRMIRGDETTAEPTNQGAKKYIAIDCEMVGVGIGGSESSLARVSVVNYYGVVEVDEFVQQKERVVDYRTKWSGIRAQDMVQARPFEEVQKRVASLIEGKVLVGHAVHHDLKALLLSHPRLLIRDTQVLAGKHNLVKSRFPALRHLVEQEFGVAIQTGEHSSVVDARATMAIFRLHRKTWESQLPKAYFVTPSHPAKKATAVTVTAEPRPQLAAPVPAKRKASSPPADAETPVAKVQKTQQGTEKSHVGGGRKSPQNKTRTPSKPPITSKQQQNPGGGRKGVSSGLSTIVRKAKLSWWKELSGSS